MMYQEFEFDDTLELKDRHARACPGHPRFSLFASKDVDGRDKPGHDGFKSGTAS
jgi:hypothetical protein